MRTATCPNMILRLHASHYSWCERNGNMSKTHDESVRSHKRTIAGFFCLNRSFYCSAWINRNYCRSWKRDGT